MTSSDEPAAGRVPREERSPREVAKEASESVVRHATFMLRAYRSESAIYGVVLVSSLIAIGWREDTDLQVLLFTLGAVVVFWLAHVYAGTVSREETGEPRLRAIVAAALTSAAHSAGMLLAMALRQKAQERDFRTLSVLLATGWALGLTDSPIASQSAELLERLAAFAPASGAATAA